MWNSARNCKTKTWQKKAHVVNKFHSWCSVGANRRFTLWSFHDTYLYMEKETCNLFQMASQISQMWNLLVFQIDVVLLHVIYSWSFGEMQNGDIYWSSYAFLPNIAKMRMRTLRTQPTLCSAKVWLAHGFYFGIVPNYQLELTSCVNFYKSGFQSRKAHLEK